MRFGTRRLLPPRAVTASVVALLLVAGVARALPSVPDTAPRDSEKISIDLKDADIRDVLQSFSKATNIEIVADTDVTGKVTVSIHSVPWREAFAKILDDANLRQEQVGDTIHVHRK